LRFRPEGAVVAVLALLYVFAAREFRTSFIADPIGPRAFPVGIGILALVVGLGLFVSGEREEHPSTDAPARLRAAVLAASLLGYAILLEPLGFIVSTTLETMALVVLFRGRFLHGFAFGLLAGIALFLLFGYGLSIPLPAGRLFSGW
jgi:putative tricarboxylic transport membrane protein